MVKNSLIVVFISMLLIGCDNGNHNINATQFENDVHEQGLFISNDTEQKKQIPGINRKPIIYQYNGNKLYFYSFSSEKKRVSATEDFLNYLKTKNVVVPQIFEKRNILILYYTGENRTNPYENRNKDLLNLLDKL